MINENGLRQYLQGIIITVGVAAHAPPEETVMQYTGMSLRGALLFRWPAVNIIHVETGGGIYEF